MAEDGGGGMAVAAVLTDVEGTTTPISFVHRTLFPFARERLPALLREASVRPEVAAALAEVKALAPEADPLEQLFGWMDADAKVTPLKALQGVAWRDGYGEGLLQGAVYPDVAPALRGWHAAGLRLAVYSSGSEEAQRLIFGHSTAGDLSGLFSGFFDTRVGAKRDAGSYRMIAERLDLSPRAILFLSDVEAELDAAAEADLRTCQLARPADNTVPGTRHPVAADFPTVAARFGLAAVLPPA